MVTIAQPRGADVGAATVPRRGGPSPVPSTSPSAELVSCHVSPYRRDEQDGRTGAHSGALAATAGDVVTAVTARAAPAGSTKRSTTSARSACAGTMTEPPTTVASAPEQTSSIRASHRTSTGDGRETSPTCTRTAQPVPGEHGLNARTCTVATSPADVGAGGAGTGRTATSACGARRSPANSSATSAAIRSCRNPYSTSSTTTSTVTDDCPLPEAGRHRPALCARTRSAPPALPRLGPHATPPDHRAQPGPSPSTLPDDASVR